MQNFRASVQYNDLKGSVAADDSHPNDAHKWLVKKGHIHEDQYVLGIRMWADENHETHSDSVKVTFLISQLRGHSNISELIQASDDPLQLQEIRIDMKITEFFSLFKQFEVTLSINGLIEGKAIATNS